MNYITSTELRTKTPKLIKALKKGYSITLMHRSRVIGIFNPITEDTPVKITDINAFKKFIDQIKPKKIVPRIDRDKIYRQKLEAKYGKSVSRR